MAEMDGVISVFESHSKRLHTTRSWDFINILEAGGDPSRSNGEELLRRANYGQDIVVGVLDTGINFFFLSFFPEERYSGSNFNF
jgi:hypothetical protein